LFRENVPVKSSTFFHVIAPTFPTAFLLERGPARRQPDVRCPLSAAAEIPVTYSFLLRTRSGPLAARRGSWPTLPDVPSSRCKAPHGPRVRDWRIFRWDHVPLVQRSDSFGIDGEETRSGGEELLVEQNLWLIWRVGAGGAMWMPNKKIQAGNIIRVFTTPGGCPQNSHLILGSAVIGSARGPSCGGSRKEGF